MAIDAIRNQDIALSFENGYAQTEVLPGVFPAVRSYHCVLQAGHSLTPAVYEDCLQILCLTKGKGCVMVPGKAYAIDELSFFVPELGQAFSLHAATDLTFTTFIVKLGEREWAERAKSHIVLPFFRKISDAEEYWQDCKTEGTRSWAILTGNKLYPVIMGVVASRSGGTIEKGHPAVAQWNVVLDDSHLVLTVENEQIEQHGGDYSYVTAGLDHSLLVKDGQSMRYIWFEYKV